MCSHHELRELAEEWRETASQQGTSVAGSLAKAEVYRDCADELEVALDG